MNTLTTIDSERRTMKWYPDGDYIFIVKDDFVDLEESPYVFTYEDSGYGRALRKGGILNLPFGDLIRVRNLLNDGLCGEV